MIKQKTVIKNLTGLNLRPAETLCGVAMKYQSHVSFEYEGGVSNAKSILSVLGAGVKSGDEITFVCSGPDEEEAMQALLDAVEQKLGE